MEKLVAYKRMPLWTKETMPEAVQQKHNTKVGTWGKITVLKGTLKFIELTEDGEVLAEHLFEAGADNPMAQPQAWHRVEAVTDERCRRKLLCNRLRLLVLYLVDKG